MSEKNLIESNNAQTFEGEEIEQKEIILGVVSYLPIVPFFLIFKKDLSSFLKCHTRQGSFLSIVEIFCVIAILFYKKAHPILSSFLFDKDIKWAFALFVFCAVFILIGIFNACCGKKHLLPIDKFFTWIKRLLEKLFKMN